MAKIQRETHKVFGRTGSTPEFAQFGSLVAAAALKTKDIATIQALPAWDAGWQLSIYGGNKDLLLQDLNSWCFEHSTQVGYILQAGVAEWDSGTNYFKGSIVQRTDGSGDATAELYASLIDNNLGNTLPVQANNANWQYLGGQSVPPGVSLEFMGVIIPTGYIWEDGTAYSRTTYAFLFHALNITLAGNTTIGQPQITGIPSTANLRQGWFLGGTGIPSGATISSIDSSSQVTMSLPATSTQTPSSIDYGPWGVGDGVTTFNVPDTRRRVGVGAGGSGTATLAAVPGAVGGEETHTLTIAEIPSHHHSGYLTPNGRTGQSGVGSYLMEPGQTGDTGGSGAHNNIQPSYVCTKIIKY